MRHVSMFMIGANSVATNQATMRFEHSAGMDERRVEVLKTASQRRPQPFVMLISISGVGVNERRSRTKVETGHVFGWHEQCSIRTVSSSDRELHTKFYRKHISTAYFFRNDTNFMYQTGVVGFCGQVRDRRLRTFSVPDTCSEY